ncbi:Predicted signal transduction protein containing EFhand domain [Pararhodospirillum photometricum DSM 122]|uniref:Predicted signal transduction protein containing EFhand domain n=2 Tax=Pararhodospirillum photometricum TaxID=1084 RepID=H6SRT8_PARPM|nr:Predicted signal transduction protein containing EFhand domain [Pararhodospirillum photometricum DSM 122]
MQISRRREPLSGPCPKPGPDPRQRRFTMNIEGASSLSYSLLAAITQNRSDAFSKLDSDSSGGVTLEELKTAGQNVPGGNNASSVEALFTQMDTDGNGEVSSSEFQTYQSSALSSDTTGSLLQAQEEAGNPLAQLMAALDTDDSGQVSEDEFTAAAGDEDSEAVAAAFDALDTDQDGALTTEELAAAAPPPPPPATETSASDESTETASSTTSSSDSSSDTSESTSASGGGGGGGGAVSASKTYDPLDTNKDGVVSEAERQAGAQSMIQRFIAAYTQASTVASTSSASAAVV